MRKEQADYHQAREQLEKSKMPKPDFYDHCLPKDSKLRDIMKRIDQLFQAYIKDQFVTRTSGRYAKKLYVGIVNSLERLYSAPNSRYEEHSGKFGQIIMLSLLEMASVEETKRIEDEVIGLAKWKYGEKLVENANNGGNGVRESTVNETRFFLYICFEA